MEPIKCEFCKEKVKMEHRETKIRRGTYVKSTSEHYFGQCKKCHRTFMLEVCEPWSDIKPAEIDLEGSRRV